MDFFTKFSYTIGSFFCWLFDGHVPATSVRFCRSDDEDSTGYIEQYTFCDRCGVEEEQW